MMRVIDLFSGCGGLSLGFQNAGFQIVAAVDNWKPAIEVYEANFKNHKIYSLDLEAYERHLDFFQSFSPDIIIGGPPCQDFSHAGKRNEDLGRGNLTISFAEIISSIKPKWFVMENVDRLTKTQKFKEAYEIMKKAGYGITVKLMNANLCDVPQNRKRNFVIGELGGEDNVLLPYLEKNLSNQPMTLRDYFGGKLGIDFYYRHPRNYSRRAVFSIDEPSPTIRGVNRPFPKGYPGHHGDATKNYNEVRPLTTQERAWVQTFPKDFKLVGSKTNVEQMVGNAVPVKLAEYVAKCIMEYINDDNKVPVNLFGYIRSESKELAVSK